MALWQPDLRSNIFGRGYARNSLRAPPDPSQSLTPFRVRQTNFACSPYQCYNPPVLGPLGPSVPRPSGRYFWAVLYTRLAAGTPMPFPKPHSIPSPADELQLRPPTKTIAQPSQGRSGLLALRPSGQYFWAGHSMRLAQGTLGPFGAPTFGH